MLFDSQRRGMIPHVPKTMHLLGQLTWAWSLPDRRAIPLSRQPTRIRELNTLTAMSDQDGRKTYSQTVYYYTFPMIIRVIWCLFCGAVPVAQFLGIRANSSMPGVKLRRFPSSETHEHRPTDLCLLALLDYSAIFRNSVMNCHVTERSRNHKTTCERNKYVAEYMRK